MSSLHQTIAAIVQHTVTSDSIVCQAAAVAGAAEVNKKFANQILATSVMAHLANPKNLHGGGH